MQFVPEDGVYVYFRYDDKQTVMCIMNTNDKPMTIDANRFAERIKDFKQGLDVTSGKTFNLAEKIPVDKKYLVVL